MDLPESDRQAIVLALAELALRRPGWDQYLSGIADRMQGREMYDRFKETSASVIQATLDGHIATLYSFLHWLSQDTHITIRNEEEVVNEYVKFALGRWQGAR
jgi:hypothetical protein